MKAMMRTQARILFIAAVALCLALCLPSLLLAQEATGRIVGQIMDPQGAVVPGVRITITNVATRIASQTVSDKDGLYQAPHLSIGSYTVTAEGQGFQKLVTVPYTLEINQTLRVDLKLQVGTTKEIVEVTGDTAQVETYNATLGYSVTSRPIVNMPLNGRNVLDLAKLEPGVTEENKGHDGAGTFSVAGGRLDSVTYLLDGGINNNRHCRKSTTLADRDAAAVTTVLRAVVTLQDAELGHGVGIGVEDNTVVERGLQLSGTD
jgi:hypothetical protein